MLFCYRMYPCMHFLQAMAPGTVVVLTDYGVELPLWSDKSIASPLRALLLNQLNSRKMMLPLSALLLYLTSSVCAQGKLRS